MIKGIEHTGICSKDTEALKNWYIQLFKLKVVYENAKSPRTYFLSLADGGMIEIYPSDADSEPVDNKTRASGTLPSRRITSRRCAKSL